MAQEKEIKVMLKIPIEQFKKRLVKGGFTNQGKSQQLDIYFDHTDWSLYKTISALRIRIVDGIDHSFSFKKVFYLSKKRDPFYIEEIEVRFPIIDSKEFNEILEKVNLKFLAKFPLDSKSLTSFLLESGFQDEQKMPKVREQFVLNDIEVTLDEVEKVGTIIELECKECDPQTEVSKLLADHEWERRSVEGTSHIWLHLNKGFTDHLENFKKFKNQPDWNVQPGERSFFESIN